MTAAAQAVAWEFVDTVTPVTGDTVVMRDTNEDGVLRLTPAGLLATLTINFPSDANSRIGQIRRIAANKAISLLSLGQIGGGFVVINGITSMVLGDEVSYQKVAANTWQRCG